MPRIAAGGYRCRSARYHQICHGTLVHRSSPDLWVFKLPKPEGIMGFQLGARHVTTTGGRGLWGRERGHNPSSVPPVPLLLSTTSPSVYLYPSFSRPPCHQSAHTHTAEEFIPGSGIRPYWGGGPP
ncbi:unnamed protein product [Pleuronectes platessa]|uniref:Uncharacterized protein n=1 Tax=Pleuronectes platessa TaxID=8262 RepID=A0A9N7TWK2_PLEPL|nr:unnamed protein product [Pleuronectes platessa]